MPTPTPTTDLAQATSTYTAMLAAARQECANSLAPYFTNRGLYIGLIGHPAFKPGEYDKTWKRLIREGRFKRISRSNANARYQVQE